jgi:hypothetical protein
MSWNENKMTICGNNWADESDYMKTAAGSCKGTPVVIGGGSMTTGYTTVKNAFNGSYSTVPVNQSCLTYRCD